MDLTHLLLSGPPSTTPSELQSWLRRHPYALTIVGLVLLLSKARCALRCRPSLLPRNTPN